MNSKSLAAQKNQEISQDGKIGGKSFQCPLSFSMSLIGGKWKCIALYHLGEGPLRFGELRRCMPNTTQRMLTLTLRELEADGIVNRKVFNVVPPHVEYSLTELGEALAPVMDALTTWAVLYHQEAPKHEMPNDNFSHDSAKETA
ncbi:Transcriptional regulator, HxlR family [hydrothermal vent metagenome]|uniref:Transcriptional regulator, HxlR family n=1 Tax=hydrothermal vent metagenome TaxID=652676 RepID=A0A3B0UHY6_9ZZZZ